MVRAAGEGRKDRDPRIRRGSFDALSDWVKLEFQVESVLRLTNIIFCYLFGSAVLYE